jgi:hypothetical protein
MNILTLPKDLGTYSQNCNSEIMIKEGGKERRKEREKEDSNCCKI